MLIPRLPDQSTSEVDFNSSSRRRVIESGGDELGAVERTGAVSLEGADVGFGAIADVGEPMVLGKVLVEFVHKRVSGDFGDN